MRQTTLRNGSTWVYPMHPYAKSIHPPCDSLVDDLHDRTLFGIGSTVQFLIYMAVTGVSRDLVTDRGGKSHDFDSSLMLSRTCAIGISSLAILILQDSDWQFGSSRRRHVAPPKQA